MSASLPHAPGSDAGAESARICPECGRQITHDRQLLRTRRHWKWACVALLLFLAADAARNVPRSQITGIAAFLPGWILLAGLPGDPPSPGMPLTRVSGDQAWWYEFYFRYAADEATLKPMWGISRRILAWGAARAVRASAGNPGRFNAAFVLAQVDPAAPERFDEALRPVVIAACSDAAYATCSSYQDIGLHKGNIGRRDETVSYTAFSRPRQLRFEYLSQHPMQSTFSMRGVIWQNGGNANMWWTLRPAIEESPDLTMPIASFTGVSSSLAYTVPMRLLGKGRGGISVTELKPDDVCDGRACYHIRQRLGTWIEDVWIDKSTFGILRIERGQPFKDITVYRPRFNVPVDALAFQFDPARQENTPLADGEKACDELRPLLEKRRTDEK
jgi:hypothetical protein